MASQQGDRRGDLLEVAASRFVEDGMRATTMESIARGAGAGKATLYRYFSDKDAVVEALLVREIERLERRMQRSMEPAGDSAARVEAGFLAALGFLVEHPLLARGRGDDPAALLERITATDGGHVERLLRPFADVVAGGVASGEFRNVDPRAAAEIAVRLLLSYVAFPPMDLRVEDDVQARTLARALSEGLARR